MRLRLCEQKRGPWPFRSEYFRALSWTRSLPCGGGFSKDRCGSWRDGFSTDFQNDRFWGRRLPEPSSKSIISCHQSFWGWLFHEKALLKMITPTGLASTQYLHRRVGQGIVQRTGCSRSTCNGQAVLGQRATDRPFWVKQNPDPFLNRSHLEDIFLLHVDEMLLEFELG